ncbi:MAG: hypothetical protein U0521_13620 [Anaerolineae bacterium]
MLFGIGVAAPVHAGGGVEQQMHGEVFLVLVQLGQRAVEACVDVPVEAAQVVAGGSAGTANSMLVPRLLDRRRP